MFKSNGRLSQAAAGRERVHRRSVGKLPGLSMLIRQVIPAGLSRILFVKRYLMEQNVFRNLNRPLDRAVYFFSQKEKCIFKER